MNTKVATGTDNKNAKAGTKPKKEYVKLSTALHDDSVKLLELEKDKALITFNFDATAGAVVSCF